MSETLITGALVDALTADPNALHALAAALAPHLAEQDDATPATGDLTAGQAAHRAGVHDRTIRRALTAGLLPGHTIAGRWRINPDDLAVWLRSGAPTSATPTHRNGRPLRTGTTAGAAAIEGRNSRT